MAFWQHEKPIDCPKKHQMIWLGSVFWNCGRCKTIYVQVPETKKVA